ncbi:MAG: M28 family peptidase [Vicinamibacterales bacterium]
MSSKRSPGSGPVGIRTAKWLAAAVSGLVLATVHAAQPVTDLAVERSAAAAVSEARMVETVRRLVKFGPRMAGTPSNHEAARWLAGAFREAGLEAAIRDDQPRDWYQPDSWEVRVAAEGERSGNILKTAWPSTGSPSARGAALVALGAAPGAVCLVSQNPTPETTTGCAAVLFDGRATPSGWPNVGRLRGAGWKIPVFVVSPSETESIRERLSKGGKVNVSFSLEARSGSGPPQTVIATFPGRDRSRHILFCAHGDSDSGGPGANDNASGVAIVLEIARTAAALVKAGKLSPAWDLRFAVWGGEISSTRQYVAAMGEDRSMLRAVFNYDQSGYGTSKDALYVEPDDVAANKELITLVRAVMKDHLGKDGFPARAASVKTQGGTDSYAFQSSKTPGATVYPAVTLYTSAWDRERPQPLTEGFPPLNWYQEDKPGMVTVDGDSFYHSAGDRPENTTDREPSNMGWCARVGLLSALRLMKTNMGK